MAASAKDTTDDLKEQLETLREDVNTLVSTLSSTAKGKANRTAEELSSEITRLSDELQTKGHNALERAEDTITEKPFQSLMVALGVGFLIGAMTRR